MKLFRFSIFLLCSLMYQPAYGWIRMTHEDAVVVQRSELIVVGHLIRGSISTTYPAPGFRHSKARLAVTEILKGSTDVNEIPITIYYGLTPIIGGQIDEDDI